MRKCLWNEIFEVYEDGVIVNPATGRVVRNTADGRVSYRDKFGVKHTKARARIVYESFSGKSLNNNDMIEFKDMNPNNCAYKNLKVISCVAYRAEKGRLEQGNKLFSYDEAYAIRLEYLFDKVSIRKLAKKYNCSLVTMNKITRGEYYCENS